MKRLRVSRKRRVITLTLQARKDGVLLDRDLGQELCHAAEQIALDDEAIAVFLRSEGGEFCRGSEGTIDSAAWLSALLEIAQPIVAVVQGDAVDEGAELAIAADIRILSRGARMRFAHLASGHTPRCGATQILPRLVGRARALELLLSGRWVRSAEAERIGLVSRSVAKRDLDREADALIAQFSTLAPLALRYAKEAVVNGVDRTMRQGLELEQDLYVLLQTTFDRSEGVRSFLEKRAPRFRGE